MGILILVAIASICVISNGNPFDETKEPTCLSRFDFDYKVLSKLVALETSINKLLETQEKLVSDARLADLERAGLQTAVDNKDAAIRSLQEKHIEMSNSVPMGLYVRWGRKTCPGNGTSIVYEGIVGGSPSSDTGSAVDYLCLTKEPLWNQFHDVVTGGAFMRGAKYEFYRNERQAFFENKALNKRDVPCSMCESKRSTVLMIAGRNQCVNGWTLEYHGYLMAGGEGKTAASEFVCVDAEPETVEEEANIDDTFKQFYFTEGRCGSLPCPPYIEGRELTCVVCSK